MAGAVGNRRRRGRWLGLRAGVKSFAALAKSALKRQRIAAARWLRDRIWRAKIGSGNVRWATGRDDIVAYDNDAWRNADMVKRGGHGACRQQRQRIGQKRAISNAAKIVMA